MEKQFGFLFTIMLLTALSCSGQQVNQDLQRKYTIVNRTLSTGADGSIHLNEADGDGIAWINNTEFTYGTLEFDIKGKDVLQDSFPGIAFHGVNDSIYETVYFRPFNFRSADTLRKTHAVQYTASPNFEWPKLRSEFPGKYEKGITPAPDPNDWFHVRIKVEPKLISVYVNGNTTPSLVVVPLVETGGKKIGYWAGGTDGNWKNLRITPDK